MTGLFRSTQDALLFAFRHAGQAYDRPMMLRMADTSRGAGAWLADLAAWVTAWNLICRGSEAAMKRKAKEAREKQQGERNG